MNASFQVSCLLLLLTTSARAASDAPLETVVPDPAWDAVFDRGDGWIGGDGIYSTRLPEGDVLWLFADSYIGRVRQGRRQPGTTMVNNALARHPLPRNGGTPDPATVRFLWGAEPDARPALAWTRPELEQKGNPAAEWYWPADAVVAPGPGGKDRLLVFLWRTARDGTGAFGFKGAGNAMAIVDNVREDWKNWRQKLVVISHAIPLSATAAQRTPEIVWGSKVLLNGDGTEPGRLLIFGSRKPQKQAAQLILARVPAAAAEDMAAWEFRSRAKWSPSHEDVAPLAEGMTTEFSVNRIDVSGKAGWVLIQSEPFLGDKILVRTAREPQGPWSAPKSIYQVPNLDRKKQHFTYAAKAHPELSRPGELLVSYVVNSLDFGESSTNAAIYRPRFIRVPLSRLPEPP
jgi:hypothetical protein